MPDVGFLAWFFSLLLPHLFLLHAFFTPFVFFGKRLPFFSFFGILMLYSSPCFSNYTSHLFLLLSNAPQSDYPTPQVPVLTRSTWLLLAFGGYDTSDTHIQTLTHQLCKFLQVGFFNCMVKLSQVFNKRQSAGLSNAHAAHIPSPTSSAFDVSFWGFFPLHFNNCSRHVLIAYLLI